MASKDTGPAPEELELNPSTTLDEKGVIKEPQPKGTVRFDPQFATVRQIRRADWPDDARPKEGSADFIWDASNGWELPSSDFTKRQLQLLAQDGLFKIT
jgi:hypothetical protein